MRLPKHADRLFNRPLAATPAATMAVVGALSRRLDVVGLTDAGTGAHVTPDQLAETAQQAMVEGEAGEEPPQRFELVGNVGVVSVHGKIVQRGDGLDAASGLVGVNRIRGAIREALDDPRATSVLLNIDSPGGEVAGVFDLADEIFEARGRKPIRAVADELAASAAFAIAAAADEVVMPETAEVGSVGVVLLHLDRSGEMEQRGVRPTLIHAGARKVDGHPFGPLPDEVRAEIQAGVSDAMERFVDRIARYRGLSTEAVRATEARTLRAAEAVRVGFADRIAPARRELFEMQRLTPQQTTRFIMAHTNAPEVAGDQPVALDQAALDAARTEGHQAGVRAERTRIQGILGCEAAQGREGLARHFAFETDSAAEAAQAALTAAPGAFSEGAAGGSSGHSSLVASLKEAAAAPDVGPDEPGAAPGRESAAEKLDPGAIYAKRRAAAQA